MQTPSDESHKRAQFRNTARLLLRASRASLRSVFPKVSSVLSVACKNINFTTILAAAELDGTAVRECRIGKIYLSRTISGKLSEVFAFGERDHKV